jgi:hypothetical protein
MIRGYTSVMQRDTFGVFEGGGSMKPACVCFCYNCFCSGIWMKGGR